MWPKYNYIRVRNFRDTWWLVPTNYKEKREN